MHVVENPNFPSLRFDPLADLFFAIADLLLKSLLLKVVLMKGGAHESRAPEIALPGLPPDFVAPRLLAVFRGYSPPSAATRRLRRYSLTCSAQPNPE